ncbi:MAG TPA: laccase domain-containing protein, partial [Acidimicrobiia bacterium]|nr:laccase domain-containing protein [Acidimicrobiia bacterium]
MKFCENGAAQVAFTNRHGGCSAQPYDSLNIANHVGDDTGNVLRNRELLHKT